MNWKNIYQVLGMSSYSLFMKVLDYVSLTFMAIVLICILVYFVKEIIRNNRRHYYEFNYDSQKDVKRKIEKEQAKVDKFLKKQLKKVRKVRNL